MKHIRRSEKKRCCQEPPAKLLVREEKLFKWDHGDIHKRMQDVNRLRGDKDKKSLGALSLLIKTELTSHEDEYNASDAQGKQKGKLPLKLCSVKKYKAIEEAEKTLETEESSVFSKLIKEYGQPKASEAGVSDFGKGVLGFGKGLYKGLPEYQFKSVWQFQLPELDAKDPVPWTNDPAKPPKEVKPIILSVVSSVSLGQSLDLEEIAILGRNLHYNPESFTPLVIKIKKPDSTALLFQSGKMVVTGTKSEKENRVATRRFARIVQKMGKRVSVCGMQIQNISATCNLGFRVRVNLLALDPFIKTQASPDIFNGITVVLECPKCKVVVFNSGSVLVTGATSEMDVEKAVKLVYPVAKVYAN